MNFCLLMVLGKGIFAFVYSVIAISGTIFACTSLVLSSTSAAFAVTTLTTAAAIIVTLLPDSKIRQSFADYFHRHQQLIDEAETLKKDPPASLVSGQVEAPWNRLWKEFKGAELRFIIPATALSILLNVIGFLNPNYTGKLFDTLTSQNVTMDDIWPLLRMRIGLDMLTWVFHIGIGILFAMARWNMSMRGQIAIFRNLLLQEVHWFDSHPIGHLAGEIRSQPDQMQELLAKTLMNMLSAGINLIGGLIMVLSCDWRLSVTGLLLRAPFVLGVAHYSGGIVGQYTWVQNLAMNKANVVVAEAIQNIRAVQTAAAEEVEVQQLSQHVRKYLNVIWLTLHTETVLRYTNFIIDRVADLALLAMGCWLIISGRLTFGQYTAFGSYLGRFYDGYNALIGWFYGVKAMGRSTARYFELLDRVSAVRNSPDAHTPQTCTGQLVFSDVSFRYPGRSDVIALHNVSFTLLPDKLLALVGPSGAGKSTIVKLCLRFYDPVSGTVSLDGVPLPALDYRWLRRQVGYVEQEPVLFDRSIRENIAYGLVDSESPAVLEQYRARRQIFSAAKIANAHDFISELPEGYETVVGAQGIRLSGGQKQRIAIARAVIRNPSMLLLDEATSSLDALSEAQVQAALSKVMTGRSTICIAHRLSTVRRANQIQVLEHGIVVETGSHQELMACKGRYAELVSLQMIQLHES